MVSTFSVVEGRVEIKLFVLAGIFCLCSGCVRSPDETLINQARGAVRQSLKDPDSARFSSEYIIRTVDLDGTSYASVCGVVNARNSFGGYAGNTRYVTKMIADRTGPGIIIYARIDDGNGAPAWSGAGKSPDNPTIYETNFEYIYWNKDCSDAVHPKTYSGSY